MCVCVQEGCFNLFEVQAFDLDIGCGYTSPEMTMSGEYTLKTDVYNFGIIMLELVTGRKPFDRYIPIS